MKTRYRGGFTLIEVTLVIAIGAVLLGASMMAFRSYRDGARVQAGKLNLATIRQGMSMYKYRRGVAMPLGYRGTGSVAGNFLAALNPPLANNSGIDSSTPVCFGSTPLTVTATAVNSITFTSPPPSAEARAGLLGNVDDRCDRLAPDSGKGLSDPWTGYTSVRPSPDPNNTLPKYTPGTGFEYDPNRQKDIWGGLAYISGQVQYVLPAPAPKPPAHLGYFPGDPPVNW